MTMGIAWESRGVKTLTVVVGDGRRIDACSVTECRLRVGECRHGKLGEQVLEAVQPDAKSVAVRPFLFNLIGFRHVKETLKNH